MAVEPEDDELLLDQEHDEGGDADEQDQEEQELGSEKPGDEGDEELEIAFGDEAAPASGERETGLVKHLRDEIRKRDKILAERGTAAPQPIEVGPKPTLEGCDYDQDKFEAEYEAWQGRKAEAQKAETSVQQQNRAVEEAWQADVRRFEARKAELKVPNAEEAIETAMAGLSQVQQAVIVKAADNPALVFAALGKHPGKLAEIASIQDPLKQAVAVTKLEATLKLTSRRKAPEPEQVERGGAPRHGTDKALERLEAEAARNGGDRTKIAAYKAQLKKQAKA
jgi:hypothetical protein